MPDATPAFHRSLCRDRRGSIAVIFALSLVPLILAAAVAVDYGRGQLFRSTLQGAVDAAALAGASAYVNATSSVAASTAATDSMAASIAQLPEHTGAVTYTVTPSAGTSAYNMTVTAQATMPTTLLALIQGSVAISATAEATNPVVSGSSSTGSFSSSAWDRNVVYWYIVPSDNSVPTLSSSNIIYSNAPGYDNSNPPKITASASQRIGFALVNTTGGNESYGNNGYGAKPGSVHKFYSSISPPSLHAASTSSETYGNVTNNCSVEVMVVSSTTSTAQAPSGSCSATTPVNAAPSCSDIPGQILKIFFNDMGGGTDDYDYNDAEFTLKCASSGSSGTGSTSVHLIE